MHKHTVDSGQSPVLSVLARGYVSTCAGVRSPSHDAVGDPAATAQSPRDLRGSNMQMLLAEELTQRHQRSGLRWTP